MIASASPSPANELMQRFYTRDDHPAFGELATLLRPVLLSDADALLPRRLPARWQLIEDLVADTFAKAYATKHRDAGRWSADRGDVLQWLRGVLRNTILSFLRLRRARERLSADMGAEPLHDVTPWTGTTRHDCFAERLRHETFDELRAAVDRLPDEHRQIIALRYFEDDTQRSIGAKLGLSPPTITRRLDQARNSLRQMLNAGETRAAGSAKPKA